MHTRGEMMSANLIKVRIPWSITVLSDNPIRVREVEDGVNKPTWFAEVKTALLYGDQVAWLAIDQAKNVASLTIPTGTYQIVKERERRITVGRERYANFISNAKECGLPLEMVVGHDTSFVQKFRQETASLYVDLEPLSDHTKSFVAKAHVLMTDFREPVVTARWWDAPSAAQILMQELAHLLLPEVGELPIAEIAELRSQLTPQLDGLRAEMLRLSEVLRTLVKSESDPNLLRHEARNLIATSVEPAVRETSIMANELMEKRWKKFLTGAAKVVGFSAAGFLQATFWAEALKEAASTATAVIDVEPQLINMRHSAHFVMEARSYLADKT